MLKGLDQDTARKIHMRNFGRRFKSKTLFAITLASLLISSLAQRYLGHVDSGANVDFFDYYFAAQVIHDNPHASLYEGATDANPQLRSAPAGSDLFAHARAAGFDDIELYLYPPLLADLLAPFSQMPAHFAAFLWRAFNLSLVLASALLLARMTRVPILSFEFAVLSLAAYSFWPIHEAISDGQIGIVLLALWTVGVIAYSEDRIIISSAAFALATAFKVTPILLLPLFFIWKDRRWLASFLIFLFGFVLAMGAVNGLRTINSYAAVMSAMGGGAPAMQNKSLSSLVAWAYYRRLFSLVSVHEIMANQPRILLTAEKAISGIFYLLSLGLVWRNRHQLGPSSKAATIAVFGLITACVSPVSWRHSYTVAFIALAVFWIRSLRAAPRALHLSLLTLTTLAVGSLSFDLAIQAPLPQICKVLFASSWVVFSILLSFDALFHATSDDIDSVEQDRHAALSPIAVD